MPDDVLYSKASDYFTNSKSYVKRLVIMFRPSCWDFQTLGEEYAGILQVNFQHQNIPSKFQRLVSVFFHCFGILISSSLIKKVSANISRQDVTSEVGKERKKTLLRILTFFGNVFDFAEKLNLSTFYIYGVYCHLSKRLTQIKYAILRQSSIDFGNVENFGKTFKILGNLTLLNLVNHKFWKETIS